MAKKKAAKIAGASADAFTSNPFFNQAQSFGGNALGSLGAALGLGGGGGAGPGGFNAQGYLSANPDVAQAFQSLSDADKSFIRQQGFPLTPEGFAQFHYSTHGQKEGRGFGDQGGMGGQGQAGPNFDNFFRSPGFQSQLRAGQEAITSSAAARGLLDSGAFAKDLTRFGSDLAAQEYQNYLGNLFNAAGFGQNAASQTAGAQQQAQLSRAGIEATRTGIGGKIGSALGGFAALNPFGAAGAVFKGI